MPYEISFCIISSNIWDLFKHTQYSFAKSFKLISINWSNSILAAPISNPFYSFLTMKWRNIFSSSNSLIFVFFKAFLTDLLDFSIWISLSGIFFECLTSLNWYVGSDEVLFLSYVLYWFQIISLLFWTVGHFSFLNIFPLKFSSLNST